MPPRVIKPDIAVWFTDHYFRLPISFATYVTSPVTLPKNKFVKSISLVKRAVEQLHLRYSLKSTLIQNWYCSCRNQDKRFIRNHLFWSRRLKHRFWMRCFQCNPTRFEQLVLVSFNNSLSSETGFNFWIGIRDGSAKLQIMLHQLNSQTFPRMPEENSHSRKGHGHHHDIIFCSGCHDSRTLRPPADRTSRDW